MKIFYGWIVVAAGALMGCVAIGTTFSLAGRNDGMHLPAKGLRPASGHVDRAVDEP